MRKILIGTIVALITFAVIFYTKEYNRSFLQLGIGLLVFIFPFMFLSSFKSTVPAFILVFFTLLSIYVIFKYGYYDVLLGILLASVIGGTIFCSRVRSLKSFSAEEFKNSVTKNTEDK